MSLDGNRMGEAIVSALEAAEIIGNLDAQTRAQVVNVWQTIGSAVVAEFVNNATIKNGVAVQPIATFTDLSGDGTGATTEDGVVTGGIE